MTLAIDRLRLRQTDESDAQRQAADLAPDSAFLLGYLRSSVAIALERPRWASRRQLAIDLRAVQIAQRREVPTR